jgi:signal transduction histidine kinase/ActR/RegA family two-component response regulator
MWQSDPDPEFLRALFKVNDAESVVAWVFCPDPNAPPILSRFARAVLPEQPAGEYRLADLLAQWQARVHPDDQQTLLDTLSGATVQGQVYSTRLRFLRADTGRYGGFDCWFCPMVRDAHGMAQWVLRAADIDERLQHDEAMLQASRRKDAFIAMLGHELRNPLAPMRTSLALIRALQPSGAILREVELIERQTALMVRLINDLLDVSRLDHDRLELALERFDLRTSVLGVQEMTLRSMAHMHDRLTVTLPEEPVMVMADPVRIRQMLSNLMRNALAYSEPGSPVLLTLSVTADHEAQIILTDAGIGIEPDRLESIFEPFSRAPEGKRRPNEGLGLGLTLAQRLVQMHGGRIEAASAGLGCGSTFTVTLPMDQAAAPDLRVQHCAEGKHTAQSVAAAEPNGALRIVVVDDNVRAADSLTLLLQHWGHAARAAYDGHRALELDEALQPDVVILDIAMPDMTGYDLARVLRARQGARDLRIIVVSGYPQTTHADPSSLSLFDQYLLKPVDLDQLRQALETRSAPVS